MRGGGNGLEPRAAASPGKGEVMSLASMTGYGRGESRIEGLRIEVEASSVNRKQFDLVLNVPRPLQVLESRIQDEVGHFVARGRITLNVYFAPEAGAAHRVSVDEGLARAYVETVRGVSRRLGLRENLDSRLLTQIPDLLRVEHPEEDIDRIWPVLQKALRASLTALVKMRRREGRALQQDLERRLKALVAEVDRIEARAPAAVRRYREQLRGRLAEAGLAGGEHADRIAREIALFAERCDITEEITRLKSHFRQARALFRARTPAGRSLDFLAQETFREINTIGSKSVDAAISAFVVRFKAEIERVREQVQNVE